ncbi:hydantoinase B/oxoprolinase family protein [Alkalimarinus coralli]|uniref:hydantoinase B/oxoprolinase family protein n=1 Tax=Alkalimarinus coralli TaxID=2935863 RepID=UPI00202B5720|nr:hydantoinase B/oxoprolinase family protein [Alkalimarinus coralli]
MNAIELNIFNSRLEAICDEMGVTLKRSAFSPNIKDRLDFSCAIFDGKGKLCAQAAHVPVHLGSMAYAMEGVIERQEWAEGDMLVMNDPFLGGTHLPDVTVIAPVFIGGELTAFVANRAHHANIGASTPGSMPVSSTLEEEGVLIKPQLLIKAGVNNKQVWNQLAFNTGQGEDDFLGDFQAQVSANQGGVKRLSLLIRELGADTFLSHVVELNSYARRLSRSALSALPDGRYVFEDIMDSDGFGQSEIAICLSMTISEGSISLDFSNTSPQVRGNINCPLSVTAAAAYYVFRCLMPEQMPACAGAFDSIALIAPKGSLVNAEFPAAVAAGNVETSTRLVDVIIGALAKASPEGLPAASQGTMNNIAMGASNSGGKWDYYETIAGGGGASKGRCGLSVVQTHMTNTLNTPIESLEMHYPLLVTQYSVRRESGGLGLWRGGDGVTKRYRFKEPATVTLLTERRVSGPWGNNGGGTAAVGVNLYNEKPVGGKVSFKIVPGDTVEINTPGGGGWGDIHSI